MASRIDLRSVRDMVEALIAGQRSPRFLAGLARGRMKLKHADLVEALTGQFDEHHAELARMLLDQIDALTAQIDTLTARIDTHLAAILDGRNPDPDHPDPGPADPGSATANGPGAIAQPTPDQRSAVPSTADLVDILDEIPGVGPHIAQVIIAEIGLDMSRFPTAGHLVSWANCAPAPSSPAPSPRPARPAKATGTCGPSWATPPPAPAKPTPSWANDTGASSNAAANSRPWSRSPAPSW